VLLIPKRHRQTDGRLTIALPRSALASRGKNMTHHDIIHYETSRIWKKYQ